jgi:hypothetical protein
MITPPPSPTNPPKSPAKIPIKKLKGAMAFFGIILGKKFRRGGYQLFSYLILAGFQNLAIPGSGETREELAGPPDYSHG